MTGINPIKIATKGKGFFPMLARGGVIASRYGITARKMDQALEILSKTVRKYACSASLPVTASALAANPMVALKYYNRGMEMAIHGYQHVDYSALSAEKQLEHIHQATRIFQHGGIPLSGFRCPYLRWNENTISSLSTLGFTYDSSQALAWDVVDSFETTSYHRVLDFYRAQSARDYPSLPSIVNGLVRIPYCLPDDEALVERLHLSGSAMVETWLALFDATYKAGELFTLGLHPERVLQCNEALQAVLGKARSLSPCVWIGRLDEIASWYLALGNTTFELQQMPDDLYHIQINAPDRATILIRSVEINTATQPWIQGYQFTLSKRFTLRCKNRPVIGIYPGSSPRLQRFLRHQGYLVESSLDSHSYCVYLDHSSFQERDERSLINKLEQDNTPLVRVSRWPESARSALTITGDIDAFTLLDYGRRIWNR